MIVDEIMCLFMILQDETISTGQQSGATYCIHCAVRGAGRKLSCLPSLCGSCQRLRWGYWASFNQAQELPGPLHLVLLRAAPSLSWIRQQPFVFAPVSRHANAPEGRSEKLLGVLLICSTKACVKTANILRKRVCKHTNKHTHGDSHSQWRKKKVIFALPPPL